MRGTLEQETDREFLHRQVSLIVTDVFEHAAYYGPSRMYLYYRPSNGPIAGALAVTPDGEEQGDAWTLATPERVPMDRTRDGLYAWVNAIARRLPILAIPAPILCAGCGALLSEGGAGAPCAVCPAEEA